MQMRARSVMAGSAAAAATRRRRRDIADVGFEEDLFGALRFGSHFQVALSAPFVQTARQNGGLWGLAAGWATSPPARASTR